MTSRALLVSFALIAASCAPSPGVDEVLPPLEGFDWLAGCWLSRDGVVERWEPTAGASISGSSLTPDADGAQVAQALRITTTADDGVSFHAQIGSQPARVYSLMSNSEWQAVFENPRNADIQRITYQRDGESLSVVLQAGEDRWESRYQPCASDGVH